MKLIFIVLYLCLITICKINAQNKTLSNSDFNLIYKAAKYSEDGKDYILKTINTVDSSHQFSKIINDNYYYLIYFIPTTDNDKNLLIINDSVELQKKYLQFLLNDSELVKNTNDFFAKTLNPEINRDTISFNKLLNYAVKFFYVYKINDKGNYLAKVCSGLNGNVKDDEKRNAQIEAFCFSSIFNNYTGEKFNMLEEFKKELTKIYLIDFGSNNNDKLFRAQGALYMLMRYNDKLIEMLKYEYNKRKEYLPFVIDFNKFN